MQMLEVQRWEVSCNLRANLDCWRVTAWIALLRIILRASLNFVRKNVAINELMSVTGVEESTWHRLPCTRRCYPWHIERSTRRGVKRP